VEAQKVIDAINDLQGMLHELDREDRVFLSGDATSRIIGDLLDHNSEDLEEVLVEGCKGYANMTDLELVEDYKYTIRQADKDNIRAVYKEVEDAIQQIISEQAEKALLEVND
jgi:hypothetical protein